MAEKVHAILGYYDGVLEGVADFRGTPHAFSIADDHDPNAMRYRLEPLSPAEFDLFSEHWQIWRRWESALRRGEVRAGAPVALPEERARYEEIEPAVERALAVPADSGPVARGDFRPSPSRDDTSDGPWEGFEVVWSLVDAATNS